MIREFKEIEDDIENHETPDYTLNEEELEL